ncbi:TolC family protein [Verrucomicrobiota bacterium sgz303538]
MNSRLTSTGSALALLGTLLPAVAGERTAPVPIIQKTRVEFATTGFHPIQKFEGELTLDRAVEIALRQNPDILQALQEIERTRGQIIEVRAQALPHITLSGSFEAQDRRLLQGGGIAGGFGSAASNVDLSQLSSSSSNSANANQSGGAQPAAALRPGQGGNGQQQQGGQTIDAQQLINALSQSNKRQGEIQNKSWRVAVEARQVIYAGGQIRAALRIARLTEDSAYFQLRDVIDRVISTTRQQFYSVLLNRALITVAEETIRLDEQQLQDQQNRFEAGTVPRFNVLQAEVQLANDRPTLIRARNDYLISQFQLAKTLALDPGRGGAPTFTAVGELTIIPRHIGLADALTLARARRPFLKVQRQTILVEVEQIKVASAGYKPRLDAHAGYEIRNRASSSDIGETVNGWFYGFTGSWDIFDGFETFGQVKQAKARLESAKVNYEDSVRQVELEVQTAHANLQQARETIESQQKNVEQALEALRLSRERLSAGAGTQLDVLNATVALTRARTTELQARADYNRALAEFDRATALDTVYDDSWKDPLAKVERSVIEKIASIGLRKPGIGPEEDTMATTAVTRTTVKVPANDGKSTR